MYRLLRDMLTPHMLLWGVTFICLIVYLRYWPWQFIRNQFLPLYSHALSCSRSSSGTPPLANTTLKNSLISSWSPKASVANWHSSRSFIMPILTPWPGRAWRYSGQLHVSNCRKNHKRLPHTVFGLAQCPSHSMNSGTRHHQANAALGKLNYV